MLGVNPVQHMLAAAGVLSTLPVSARQVLTGTQFFPSLIAAPFHHGLVVVFTVAAALAAVAGLASLLRGGRYVHPEAAEEHPEPARVPDRGGNRA